MITRLLYIHLKESTSVECGLNEYLLEKNIPEENIISIESLDACCGYSGKLLVWYRS